MKITKLIHSCLLVEMPAPVNRTVLFDPGVFSEPAVDVDKLAYLDDIIITHGHEDHMSIGLISKLVSKFPEVRITAAPDATRQLEAEGLTVFKDIPQGVELFGSPHQDLSPMSQTPDQIGVHYLGRLTHPGDSHNFTQTKEILALPITAPWGSMLEAVRLALRLKPKIIIPIHDWHWNEDARRWAYGNMEKFFKQNGIVFISPENGLPFVLDDA